MPYATATRPGSHWDRLGLFLCDGIDSFSWIVYVVVITLASRVFEYFLRFLLLACVSCAFWLRWGFPLCVTPYFLAYPHVFPAVRSLYRVFWLYLAFSRYYSCVGADRHADSRAISSTSLTQCGFFGVFLRNFAIFALVSDYLGIFLFSS